MEFVILLTACPVCAKEMDYISFARIWYCVDCQNYRYPDHSKASVKVDAQSQVLRSQKQVFSKRITSKNQSGYRPAKVQADAIVKPSHLLIGLILLIMIIVAGSISYIFYTMSMVVK